MNYGKAIRVGRSVRGLTQKDLARKARLDASYVCRLETGRRNPSKKALQAVATGLGMPMDLLLLLGAEKDDLCKISEAQALELGKAILNVLQ